jgi:acetyltransferase-like isoleucine patch superfamily enzyme
MATTRLLWHTWRGNALQRFWKWATHAGAIGAHHRQGRAFQEFGVGSAICFPVNTIYGAEHICIGAGVLIGPSVTLSAGVMPGHVPTRSPVVRIGDGTLIGRGSGIVGHVDIEIGKHVFTGHHVYITDANHGYEDLDRPIGAQFSAARPVRIGDGSWIGHGAIVLPGATIGEHVVIGAGSVVSGDIPPRSVAVGNPARVIKRYVDGEGWQRVDATTTAD